MQNVQPTAQPTCELMHSDSHRQADRFDERPSDRRTSSRSDPSAPACTESTCATRSQLLLERRISRWSVRRQRRVAARARASSARRSQPVRQDAPRVHGFRSQRAQSFLEGTSRVQSSRCRAPSGVARATGWNAWCSQAQDLTRDPGAGRADGEAGDEHRQHVPAGDQRPAARPELQRLLVEGRVRREPAQHADRQEACDSVLSGRCAA
jgi:hypothetical protein